MALLVVLALAIAVCVRGVLRRVLLGAPEHVADDVPDLSARPLIFSFSCARPGGRYASRRGGLGHGPSAGSCRRVRTRRAVGCGRMGISGAQSTAEVSLRSGCQGPFRDYLKKPNPGHFFYVEDSESGKHQCGFSDAALLGSVLAERKMPPGPSWDSDRTRSGPSRARDRRC